MKNKEHNIKNPQEISVRELMNNHLYTIPIYQRNYAWGELEITQLIQDIYDAYQAQDNNYYLGSLVVADRTKQDENNANLSFETIDGQQRYTTLVILCAVLKNLIKKMPDDTAVSIPDKPNLSFDCRTSSNLALEYLFSTIDKCEQCELTIKNGFDYCLKYLKKLFSETDELGLIKFTNYFFDKVKIIRIIVPEDTDLNHYFEIMNNRGEQLEKHEILKARLLDKLGASIDKKTDRDICALIWDACANMQRYAIMSFPPALRTEWFGNDYQTIPRCYSQLYDSYEKYEIGRNKNKADISSQPQTLEQLLQSLEIANVTNTSSKDKRYDDDRFDSIIDFPNFLLQVLNITEPSEGNNIALDDKRLLDQFDAYIINQNDKENIVQNFILKLLQTRLIFDAYIIKRDIDKWSLMSVKKPGVYTNTFEKNNNFNYLKNDNNRLIMLQSMFHVSFPSHNYKHWLNAILRDVTALVFNNAREGINSSHHVDRQEKIARRFFIERLTHNPLISEPYLLPESSLHQGTAVHNFIFNYLDYHLWVEIQFGNAAYILMPHSDSDKNINIKNHADNFSFTARSSIEHYWPQHPEHGEQIQKEQLINGCNNFANLCLISHQQNSRLSNLLPTAKKEYYIKSTATESLKQILMMSYMHWGYSDSEFTKQGIANMQHHLEIVLNVLRHSLKDEPCQWCLSADI